MNKEYMEAVNKVCMDCAFWGENCNSCPQNSRFAQMSDKESALIDYILEKINSCPFGDGSGMNFDECYGFRSDGCRTCIYRNTDKLLKQCEEIIVSHSNGGDSTK